MTNKELQKLLANFPDGLEVQIYDSNEDTYNYVSKVRIDEIFSMGRPFKNVVQIVAGWETSND